MDDLARLVATDEIRRLAYAYALAIDARDLDALVALFVDDVQVGRERRGREALREDFDRQLREVGVTILFVGNHLIDFDGDDAARGTVYCKAEVQQGDRWLHQAIQYRDVYALRDGRWHFVRRRHLLWYGSAVGENPLGLPPANWPEHQHGRGTLPESWETWQRFWKRDG
jgi:ketosteroid isomerase-like protein